MNEARWTAGLALKSCNDEIFTLPVWPRSFANCLFVTAMASRRERRLPGLGRIRFLDFSVVLMLWSFSMEYMTNQIGWMIVRR